MVKYYESSIGYMKIISNYRCSGRNFTVIKEKLKN